MCGLIWAHKRNGTHVHKTIKKRFENQRTRGVEGFGFIEVRKEDGMYRATNLYRAQNETDMKAQLNQATASDILFHHRIPTSTPNLLEATHPIYVSHETLAYDYFVIHNGMISNADRMKKDHEAKGYVYNTICHEYWQAGQNSYATGVTKFNDSEAFAIDIVEAIEFVKPKTESFGSIAFIALRVNKETHEVTKLYYGRNTNPLKLETTNDLFCLSSAGNGKEIEAHVLYEFDYVTALHSKVRDLDIGYKYVAPVTPLLPHGQKSLMGYNTTPATDLNKPIYSGRSGLHHADCECMRCTEEIENWYSRHYNTLPPAKETLHLSKEDRASLAEMGLTTPDDRVLDPIASFRMADGNIKHFYDEASFADYWWDLQDRMKLIEDDLETARNLLISEEKDIYRKKIGDMIEEYENQLTDLDEEVQNYNNAHDAHDWQLNIIEDADESLVVGTKQHALDNF